MALYSMMHTVLHDAGTLAAAPIRVSTCFTALWAGRLDALEGCMVALHLQDAKWQLPDWLRCSLGQRAG